MAVILETTAGGASDSLSYVVNITGGIAGSFIFFIIPGMIGAFNLREKGDAKTQQDRGVFVTSVAIMVFGFMIMAIVVGASINQLSNVSS